MDFTIDSASFDLGGRWKTSDAYIYSRWQGSQINFVVTGTSKLILNVYVKDENVNKMDQTAIIVNIDNGKSIHIPVTSAPEKFTGEKIKELNIPSNSRHSITLKLSAWPESQINEDSMIGLRSVTLDKTGKIIPSNITKKQNAAFIGDSWMATVHDWPRMLKNNYNIYPVSFGGATIIKLNENFLKYSDDSKLKHPEFDLIVIGSGVNDFNMGVSESDYEKNLNELISKIRSRNKSSEIIVLQAPDNLQKNKKYSKYSRAIDRAISEHDNTKKLALSKSAADELVWEGDGSHLTYESLKLYSSEIEKSLPKKR